MKHIMVLSLGGTISYMGKNTGDLQAKDLVEKLGDISAIAEISYATFRNKASSSLSLEDIIELAAEINKQIAEGADGFVITQGTDTIEESAFMLDLLLDRQVPIVVTGAMKNPSLHGADGLANLLSSIQVAASDESIGMGVLVCFHDEIHSSTFVRKTHTQSLGTFKSECGPIGWIAEGKPRIVVTPKKFLSGKLESHERQIPSVALYTVPMDDDGRLLMNILDSGYKGLVIEGLGGGHVPASIAEIITGIATEIPVILASRTGTGEILTSTYYGYVGSETFLIENGLISAGILDGRKARVLLNLLVTENKSLDEIKTIFSCFSKK